MQKCCFVGSKMSQPDLHNVPSADESRLCVPNDAAPLQSFLFQPLIHQIEVFAAMVNLVVVVPSWLSVFQDRQVFRSTIAHPGQSFGEMDHSIRVVSDAEQEHLPIQFIESTHRAIQPVGDVERMRRGDFRSPRAERGEGVRAVASCDSWKLPECIRNNTHSNAACCSRDERMIIVVTHTRHHQSAWSSKSVPKCRNQTLRSTFPESHLRTCSMDLQNSAGLYAQAEQLLGQFCRTDRVHGSKGFSVTMACQARASRSVGSHAVG